MGAFALATKSSGDQENMIDADDARHSTRATTRTNAKRLSASSFHDARRAIIQSSASPSARKYSENDLWEEWAKSDPQGMLNYLANIKGWPKGVTIPFYEIARTRPDLLLDFVLEQGHKDALSALSHGDLITISNLLAALPEDKRGKDVIEFEENIHEKMGNEGYEMHSPSTAFLRGEAEALLDEGRLDEFYAAFDGSIESRHLDEMAEALGYALSEGQLVGDPLDYINRLPSKYRKIAASEYIDYSEPYVISKDFTEHNIELIDEFTGLLDRFASEGYIESASNGIYDLFDAAEEAELEVSWLDWIYSFPQDGSWNPIKKEIFESWALKDGANMVKQISSLADGPFREQMVFGSAEAFHEGFGYTGEQRNQMKDLEDLLTNPASKKRFEEKFNHEDDPFAADDPFSPVQAFPVSPISPGSFDP